MSSSGELGSVDLLLPFIDARTNQETYTELSFSPQYPYVGYAFLYASNVVRPGEQINRNVNPTQSVARGGDPPAKPVGPLQPTFSFNTTDFWAQSLSLGFAYRF